MSLRPEASIATGLAVAGVVYAIHSQATPTMADVQALPAGNADVDHAERRATWLSIGVVSGISLLAKDATVLVIGAAATVAMAFMYRHANWTESMTGLLHPRAGSGQSPVSSGPPADALTAGPQMSATDASNMYSGASEFVTS